MASSASSAASAALERFTFKVTGKVQGVFFRKFTEAKAKELGVRGWVQNTEDGTAVIGEAEGKAAAMAAFRQWLSKEGSPKSVITGASFTEAKAIAGYSFEDFGVKR